ncbi:hypothetical protein ACFXPF_32560, partial [Streptomyces sp. NPDC059131]
MSDPAPAPHPASTDPAGPGAGSSAAVPAPLPDPVTQQRPSVLQRVLGSRILRPVAVLVLLTATVFAVGGSLQAAGAEISAAVRRPGGALLLFAAVLANTAG